MLSRLAMLTMMLLSGAVFMWAGHHLARTPGNEMSLFTLAVLTLLCMLACVWIVADIIEETERRK